MQPAKLFGGIEAGGTKFVCVVATGPDQTVAQARFNTSSPETTLAAVTDFFRPYCLRGEIEAIGVGCFGPIDRQPQSPTYGFITTTPKPGWQNVNVVGPIGAALSVPVAFDMDVNAAALGEHTWGASRGLDPSLYVTIGTGIGGGIIMRGSTYHGLLDPEMGHIRIPHDLARDAFPGSCPFHGDCFEGLASGPALVARFGRRGEMLRDDDPFWDLEAEYIACALATYILVLSPRIVILAGGIMQRQFLLPRIRTRVQASLAGYVSSEAIASHIDKYIVAPSLGDRSGVLGAIVLASQLQAGAQAHSH